MERVSSGSKIIDDLLDGGFEKGVISTLYGEAGSGKTNIALLASINIAKTGRVVFIDSEGGFSIERIKQLASEDSEKVLKNIIVLEPTSFEEQKNAFDQLYELAFSEDISLVVIDSIAMLYRLNLDAENVQETNRELARQLRILSEIARKKDIAILVTNQVYSDFETKDLKMVGGDLLKYWSKAIVKLEKESSDRKASMIKHRSIAENKSVLFEITEKEIKELKKKRFSLF